MRLGVVELAAVGEPALYASLNGDVAWRSTAHNLPGAATGSRVDTIVFHVDVADREDLFEAIDQARSLKPSVKLLLAATLNDTLVVAEINSMVLQGGPRRATAASLTARENQVLREIRSGRTNREIAGFLGISLSTANRHVENILKKLSARNRAQAVAETPVSGRELPSRPKYPDFPIP